jgi:hypothetical protein
MEQDQKLSVSNVAQKLSELISQHSTLIIIIIIIIIIISKMLFGECIWTGHSTHRADHKCIQNFV